MTTGTNEVYQFSLINALMAGVVEQGTTASALARRGNQGLGTFAHMRGELVLLDGVVYQLLADGSVCEAEPDQTIPFAMATQFEAQKTLHGVDMPSKEALDAVLEQAVPDQDNLFVLYRIEGGFYPALEVRAICGQEYAGQPLSEVGRNQRIMNLSDCRGTIVGFRSPLSWQGFSVAGQHLHFISGARNAGGHVLDLVASNVTIHLAIASKVHVDLPTSAEFNKAKLETAAEDIKSVEG